MRANVTTIATISLLFAGTAADDAQFCTQDQKQLVNQLHEQNEDPAKSCYRAANGDITTATTSRLCSLPECVTWLEYMATNSPDCYYDSTNYAMAYAAKSAECTGESTSVSSSASIWSSSSGSEGSASTTSSGSIESTSEDRDLNSTDSLSSSIAGSVVGSLSERWREH